MGRKTFESMSGKPLPGRLNIVVTRQPDWKAAGVMVVHSLADAIFVASSSDYKEMFIIGGGELYREALPKAHRIYLTRVYADLEGDTFFPEINEDDWKMVTSEVFAQNEKHAYAYDFQLWERK
ncbi:MAG: hypothetical protein NVS3B15_03520 [Sediminibacterium sp.]